MTTAVGAHLPVRDTPESDTPGMRPRTMTTPSPEWPVMLETPPCLPPTALGDPLEADPDKAGGWLWSDVDPVDIGPALDADDPPADVADMQTESLLHIGELLDADDPPGYAQARPNASPLQIGELLDVDAPTGQ